MRYRHEDEDRLTTEPLRDAGPPENHWLLPAETVAIAGAVFTRRIVARQEPRHHNEAPTGELLIPAPVGATPRRAVRRYMTIFGVRRFIHFFVGCGTGLPAAFGWIEERPPTTAEEFAQQVRAGGVAELAEFSTREAWFVLSSVARVDIGDPVTVAIAERVDGGTRREELGIRRLPAALAR